MTDSLSTQIEAPIKGTLRGVWSPELRNRRDVDVYLPATYASGRRYPAVYMHDGQNLSDPSQAFAGTWQLDEVLRGLAIRGMEPIVVGIHNTGARLSEYSPFADARHKGGLADKYLRFIAETLKPRIDGLFRTRRGASSTVIAGSSMGGLVSLYGWLRRPNVFGHAMAMSPSLWFGRDRLFAYVDASAALPPAASRRLYLDVGTSEGAGTLRDARAMVALLEGNGLVRDRNLKYLEDRGGRHEEAAWGGRLEDALAFLLQRQTD